jgi:hypothetical protein
VNASRRPVSIRSGAQPFQTAVLLGVAISGLLGVFVHGTRAESLLNTYDSGISVMIFSANLALWCLVALSGTVFETFRPGWRSEPLTKIGKLRARLRREQVGLIGFSGSLLAFSIAVISSSGLRGIGVAIWIALFAVACVWRSIDIHHDLRTLDAVMADPAPVVETPTLVADPTDDPERRTAHRRWPGRGSKGGT